MYLSESLDIRNAVPARLATARNGAIHDVIRNEEECLKLSGSDYEYFRMENGEHTNSIHHPRRAALKYSSSVGGRFRRIVIVSTTDTPRLSLPPGTL
jgi:hypothetical protein